MAQLVQLQNDLSEVLDQQDAHVIVVFREESEGQEGLRKVVEQTQTDFTLALDMSAEQTRHYSPGKMVHDSYIVDSDGIIRAILPGTRYDRAQSDEFASALSELSGRRERVPAEPKPDAGDD